MTTPIDLDALTAEFLTQCGSCDYGLPTSCTCTKRDYRPTMLALVREVERLRGVSAAAKLWLLSEPRDVHTSADLDLIDAIVAAERAR